MLKSLQFRVSPEQEQAPDAGGSVDVGGGAVGKGAEVFVGDGDKVLVAKGIVVLVGNGGEVAAMVGGAGTVRATFTLKASTFSTAVLAIQARVLFANTTLYQSPA